MHVARRGPPLRVETYLRRLQALEVPETGPAVDVLTERWESLVKDGEQLLGNADDEQQVRIVGYSDSLARTVMAPLLIEQAAHEVIAARGHRKLLVANTYLHLLRSPSAVPRAALEHRTQLADGGDVPVGSALAALDDPTDPEVLKV